VATQILGKEGINYVRSTDPAYRLREVDQTAPAGMWQLEGSSGDLLFQCATAADWSASTTVVTMTSTPSITIHGTVVFSANLRLDDDIVVLFGDDSDYYMGYSATADVFEIGTGSTINSNVALKVASDGVVRVEGAIDVQGGYANGGGAPYDGVVDAGGGGNWATAQAGDDALDGGDYTMLVKAGSYSTLTVDDAYDVRIVVEPGATFSGAVVLSGHNTTLVLGAGCAMSGLITLSGNNCSLICENGVDTAGVLLSGNGGYLNGGGWGSLMDGGAGANGINITGDDCIAENVAAQNTSPGPGTHSATRVAGARAVMRTVKVLQADIAGIETTSGGTDLLIDGCFLLDSDNEGMYIAGPRARIIGCHVLSAGADGIALKAAADNSLVIGCVVQDQANDSVDIDTNSENCVVVGNRLDGAVNDNSGTSTVASNDETAF